MINPKKANEEFEAKSYWYNYYAGYSHSFAKNIIDSFALCKSSVILDPWNGAGTTTLMSSVGGYKSIGIDLNPVMKVIAKAKQVTRDDVVCIESRLSELTKVRFRRAIDEDPLNFWFRSSGVLAVRKVERWILGSVRHKSMVEKVNSLSASDCVLYTALFNCVREYLKGFIPSNPTWIKKPKFEVDKIDIDWRVFKDRYICIVLEMIQGLELDGHLWSSDCASFMIASSVSIPLPDECIDLVLSSPPYCTRIDYGVATLPELAIISDISVGGLEDVRRSLMGTTTVQREAVALNSESLGVMCVKFLEDVRSHSSKSSATYYYKNLSRYFIELNKSLSEVARVLKQSSSFVCVVQDSYYKDVLCDLPSIIVEMAAIFGLNLKEKFVFESKQNMVNLNARSRSYRKQSKAYESVLIFSK